MIEKKSNCDKINKTNAYNSLCDQISSDFNNECAA